MCSIEAHNIDAVSAMRYKSNIEHFQIEIFHEQLPLPVPCYDLLPVIELTVGHDERELRVFPTPLS